MKSSRLINYNLRPAKNIERKMIRDVLLRMGVFLPLHKYQYIGFGANYFTDFYLFHKYLHIKKMISIEGDIGNKKRYEFNKPLRCIDLKFGLSNEILPEIPINGNTIIWLDYDGLLDESCLIDVTTVASAADTGTVLLISYNSRPLKSKELEDRYSSESLKDRPKKYLTDLFGGDSFIPYDATFKGLSKWLDYSKLLGEVVRNSLKSRLSISNRGATEKLLFKQIFNFNYKDGVEMSTLGFVFYKEGSGKIINECSVESFDFCTELKEPYTIEVPNLTLKEIKHINESMPPNSKNLRGIKKKGIIPPKDLEAFSKIYKYMPNYQDSGNL